MRVKHERSPNHGLQEVIAAESETSAIVISRCVTFVPAHVQHGWQRCVRVTRDVEIQGGRNFGA